jgi:glycosyltransferase involved in cell wall biosynthesis
MAVPKVSILVPVYNGEPYLAECIDSILAQDFRDFEVLISDDGSKDRSSQIIGDYANRDSRIRWWRNERNLGIGGNWNACLRAAQGTFIKFMLQDDRFLHPGALGRMVGVLQNSPKVSLVVTASNLIDARSRCIEYRDNFGLTGTHDGKAVIVRCWERNANLIGEPSLALFRKAPAERGFDEKMVQLLDLEMWFHLLEQGDLGYIAEPLCAFRRHPAQQTEINARNGAGADEQMILFEKTVCKTWMVHRVSPRAMFVQIYYLRKDYGDRAKPICAEMIRRLGKITYAKQWVIHKITRPFWNLRRSVKRRIRGSANESGAEKLDKLPIPVEWDGFEHKDRNSGQREQQALKKHPENFREIEKTEVRKELSVS